MANTYKERIYQNYYTTHVLPRKGALTLKRLVSNAKSFDLHFAEFLPECKSHRILDLGCGSGALVWWLQQKGFTSAAGIDLSSDQIEAGRNLNILNLYHQDIDEHIKECGQLYNLIFLRDVVEHISPDDLLPFLDKVCLSLENNGELVIQTPNASSPFFGRVLYGDFSHERAFTTTSLSQVLALTGFGDFRFKPFLPRFPKSRFSDIFSAQRRKLTIRKICWRISNELYRKLLYIETGVEDQIVTHNLIVFARKMK